MTNIHFKVMASEDHHFLSSSLYSSGTLVAWDPAPFSSDLSEVNMILPSHLYAILASVINLVTVEFVDDFSGFILQRHKKSTINFLSTCWQLS